MPRTKTLDCRQCDGEMRKTNVRRLGGCLTMFGYLFVLCGLLLSLLGAMSVWGGASATGETTAAIDQAAFDSTLEALEAVEGGPWPFVAEFKADRGIKPETIESLPEPPRSKVAAIVESHDLSVAAATTGAVIGGGMFVGMGGLLLAMGISGFVVGLLLTLKKKVWKCRSCGFVLDRA